MDIQFELPITYITNKELVNKSIIEDLQLIPNENDISNESNNNEYTLKHIFHPKTQSEMDMVSQWAKYYTSNRHFLKDSQNLYKNSSLKKFPDFYGTVKQSEKQILFSRIEDLQSNENFCDQYNYIDWKYCKWLNNYSWFLQLSSMLSLASPILTLCAPFFLLIIPFLILKFNGIAISFSSYYRQLIQLFSQHAFSKLFTNFTKVSWEQRIYLLFSAIMYVFQIYSNIQFCFRFYKNMNFISDTNNLISNFITNNNNYIETYTKLTRDLKSYEGFNKTLTTNKKVLNDFNNKIKHLNNFKLNFTNLLSMGEILKHYYSLFYSNSLINALQYMEGFQSYIGNIIQLNKQLMSKEISIVKLQSKLTDGYLHFKDIYYPSVNKSERICNDIKLTKNMLITGPNASGKTTILKATLLNVLLSQQLGCGCYSSGSKIRLYDKINCYINIPDTSGRDSLFQSEARRCKEIYDSVLNNHDKFHFCIFDELYSGTNPYEAISASYSFINHLSKRQNIDFMLTTHYIDLCQHLEHNKQLRNCSMKTIDEDDDFKYTYEIDYKISNVRGGVKVLKELDYPESMIKDAKNFLRNIELLSIKNK